MFSAISVQTPPTAEPVSVDLARQHCRIDFEDDDALLTLYITVARQMVESYLARALMTQTLRWVMAHSAPPTSYPFVPFTAFILPLWAPWPFLFGRPLELPRSPVQSIVSVQSGCWGDNPVTLDASKYQVDLGTDPARLRMDWGAQRPSEDVSVVFVAGYKDAASIPPPIILAILTLVAWLYENRGDVPAEMPAAVYHLLAPYRVMFFGG